MTRLERFNRCIKGPWTTSGFDVQWRWKDKVLTFQCTSGRQDWMFNFFAGRVRIGDDLVHAGFASLWESVRYMIDAAVGDSKGFTIEGYSQGAALATLAYRHYYLKGNEPKAFVFGSPKVFASKAPMPDLENIQVHGDLVTLQPPFPWFVHSGTRIRLGKKPLFPSPLLHTPDSYRKVL